MVAKEKPLTDSKHIYFDLIAETYEDRVFLKRLKAIYEGKSLQILIDDFGPVGDDGEIEKIEFVALMEK